MEKIQVISQSQVPQGECEFQKHSQEEQTEVKNQPLELKTKISILVLPLAVCMTQASVFLSVK